MLPVLPLLKVWLAAELAVFEALPKNKRIGRGWLVNYYGRPINDVETAWESMLTEPKLPATTQWKLYLLRHSRATLARN